MEYKVFYYEGEKFGIKTLVKIGKVIDENKKIILKSKKDEYNFKKVLKINEEYVNGIGNILRVELKSKKVVYFAAYKGICIANFFARIDNEKTNALKNLLIKNNKII